MQTAGIEPLHRALALAERALFLTPPNPRVGCVITAADGAVLGEGHTQAAGGPHAEVMALRDAAALLAIAADARTEAIDLTDLTNRVSERIARDTERGDSLSTQEAIWTVLAARALSQATPPVDRKSVV